MIVASLHFLFVSGELSPDSQVGLKLAFLERTMILNVLSKTHDMWHVISLFSW